MIILIDGPSGSGKTTLANRLGYILGWPVVHLDDFYPGWSGLAAGREMVAGVILERKFQRWDWDRNAPGAWVTVPGGDLIVEGVGAVSEASISAGGNVMTILVEAPADVRKARALNRDPGYAPYWEQWAAQEREHFAHLPDVDITLGGSGELSGGS